MPLRAWLGYSVGSKLRATAKANNFCGCNSLTREEPFLVGTLFHEQSKIHGQKAEQGGGGPVSEKDLSAHLFHMLPSEV